jgi:hypothetical protein
MTLLSFYLLTLAVSSGLLVLLYIGTLIKVLTGKRFAKMLGLIIMLLVANLFYFLESCG